MRGNFLPDKEFRYLRHCCYSLSITSITSTNLEKWTRPFLPDSPCRHEGRTVSSSSQGLSALLIDEPRVQSLRIPRVLPRVSWTVVFRWHSFDTPFGRSSRTLHRSN